MRRIKTYGTSWGDYGLIEVDDPAALPVIRPTTTRTLGKDCGRRATFYTTGMEHSPTSATGTAADPTGTAVTSLGLTAVLSVTDSSVVFRPKQPPAL
jgi:hypothetical protein